MSQMTTHLQRDPEPGDPLRQHRLERFLSLGFDLNQANTLADALDAFRFPLWWGTVKLALDTGCSHAQAVVIFA